MTKKTKTPVEFKKGQHVVYPAHGVGQIIDEEVQQIGEHSLRVFVIRFEKDKMTLRVPVTRAAGAGLRLIGSKESVSKAVETLKSKARIGRGMWSRRVQEYETKINSGDLQSLAEVVRDLHPNMEQGERSYSERMIYESALGRLAGEIAIVHQTDPKVATKKLLSVLKAKKIAAEEAEAAA